MPVAVTDANIGGIKDAFAYTVVIAEVVSIHDDVSFSLEHTCL